MFINSVVTRSVAELSKRICRMHCIVFVGAYFTISFAVDICTLAREEDEHVDVECSLGRAPTKFAYNYAAGEFLGY